MPSSVSRILIQPLLTVLAIAGLLTEGGQAQELGTDWVSRWPSPSNNDILRLASNGNASFVAVGKHDTIISGNTVTALTRTSAGFLNDWRGVAWCGTKYVAVGSRGTIISSPDGVTWTRKYQGSGENLQTVVWTGSNIVVAGGYPTTSGYVLEVVNSTDGGENWARRVYTDLPAVYGLIWNGQMLVGLADGGTVSSFDGKAWVRHTLPNAISSGTSHTSSIAWMPNSSPAKFVVTGDTVWTSPDGVVWAESSDLLKAIGTGASLSWTGSELVCTRSSTVLSTADLVTFTDYSSNVPTNEGYAFRYNGELVFAGRGGHLDSLNTGSTPAVWTPRNSTANTTTISSIAYGNINTGTAGSPVLSPLYVAVGTQQSWTSVDGNNWVERPLSGNYFLSVAYVPDATNAAPLFVASGLGIYTSPNGIDWTKRVDPDSTSPQLWYLVKKVGSKFYASGYDSKTNTSLNKVSTDAITWTAGSLTSTIYGIAANTDASTTLAVGASGAVQVSKDGGATWSSTVVTGGGVAYDLVDVAFGNGIFVVVDASGRIWNTSDGTQWTQAAFYSDPLSGVVRGPTQFIAAGNSGTILRSFDGLDWQAADSQGGQNFKKVIYAANRLTAVGEAANIASSQGTPPVRVDVSFASATSTMSEGGSVGITVQLSQPVTITTQVSLVYGGTATTDDFTGPATLNIPAGASSALLVISSKDNNVVAPNKTLTVTLSAPRGDIVLNSDSSLITHTVTIQESDAAPAFDVPPSDQLAVLGSQVVFTCHATGSGTLSYVWKKNGTVIPKATTSSYTIAKTTAADAASYTVTVTGNVGTATSTAGRLGLVTVQSLSQTVVNGGNASFTATAVGPDLHFKWRNHLMPLTDAGRITGSGTSKLNIATVAASDSDTYYCDVTLGTGTTPPLMTATTVNYNVLGAVPMVTTPAPVTTRVVDTIDFTPNATGLPTSWTVTGLPPGITANNTTGRITGKFSKSGPYSVKFVATNLKGPSAPATMSIQVDPLPSTTLGTFMALLDRNPALNANLGGRLDLQVTASGSFTGKLAMPTTPQPFTGVLSGATGSNPTASVAVPKTPFTVAFTLDIMTGALTATVLAGTPSVSGTGFGQASADAVKRVGNYNFTLIPDAGSPTGHPEGHGYGQINLVASGAFNLVGMLADGTPYTVATFTGPDGSIPVHAPLYSGKGSLHGLVKLNEHLASGYTDNFITGAPSWYKAPDSTSRSYAAGIPLMTLNADGGRYNVPGATDIVMKLPAGTGNAKLLFSGASVESASRTASGNFTVAAVAKVTPPSSNLAATTLVFDSGKGLFSGQFTLVDTDMSVTPHVPVTRVTTYNGVLIRPAGSPTMMEGHGFFNLAQMPTASPKTTPATSPKLSGLVSLSK